jgi:hypothetical protein
MASAAAAQGKKVPVTPAQLPALGDPLPVAGHASWPKQDYLYDVPSQADAAGKVVVHWFCAPKVATCTEDLARVVTLKENGRVYVVAHIAGNRGQAKKLDPIRESEGVGRGTVAFGKGAVSLAKQLGFTGPASIIVGVDGKIALVSTAASPGDLDARDKKVNDLVAGIKEYVAASSDSPKGVKPNDMFTLSMTVKLSPWLSYSKKTPMGFKLTAPPDFKCDAKELKGDQLKIDPAQQTLTAAVTCAAPRGIYEARGELRFGYQTLNNEAGLGTEGAKWKFEVK